MNQLLRLSEIKQEGLGRYTTDQLVRLGVPIEWARSLASGGLKLLHPVEFLQRKLSARSFSSKLPHGLREFGFAKIDTSALEIDSDDLVEKLQKLKDDEVKETDDASSWPVHVLKYDSDENGKTAAQPEILKDVMRFLSQKSIIDLVKRYVGEFPILGNVTLTYFDVSSEIIGGKSVHRDMNTPNRVHLILLVSDVDSESGPFTALNRKKSSELSKRINYKESSIEDSVFFNHIDRSELQELCGKAGDVFLADPFQCFHFGGRCAKKPRLMLIASYTSAFAGQEERFGLSRLKNRKEFSDGTSIQNKLLQL